ncbi:hypothetical protein GCK32_009164 [Trichostrongylus colubriformis]|uniref:Uncharacterized protein n=1 Tax=Trichostrongylus colubriformis TaxID=6319 RepID=A0AAN8FKA1_TRICO
MFGTMFYCTWSYICFADLSASIPFLVFLHACSFGSACLLVVAAGSVCMSPSLEADNEIYQASLIRFIGTFANMGSNTIFLASVFGRRVETLQVISRIMFYIGEGLMFLANERTF